MVVRRLELSLLFLAFDRHLAGQWLLRVLDVLGEWSDRLVVAFLRWVCGLESLIMLDQRRSLRFGRTMWDLWVLLKNLLISIECIRMFGSLTEWLILHHRLRVFALSRSEVLRSIVIVLHVDDSAAKVHLLAVLTLFNRIGSNVGRLNDDIVGILFRAIVFLDLDEVRHVSIRCRV